MHNVVILGSGRSGTSLAAGILASAGYFIGETPLPPTDSNPKGYYESREVEAVNDAMIAAMLRPRRLQRWVRRVRPLPPQPNFQDAPKLKKHWLALIPPRINPAPTPQQRQEIARLTARTPFCFKDPRFSYTLPAWRPYLHDTVYLVVFRDPAVTVASILNEIETNDYLAGLSMSPAQVFMLWVYTYQHILEKHRHSGAWLFMHYDQLLSADGLARVAVFTDAPVDASFPDEGLRRSKPQNPAPDTAQRIYTTLCQLAGYTPSAS
jgi:hypothetical protein